MKTIILTLLVVLISLNLVGQAIYEPGKKLNYLDYYLLNKDRSEITTKDTINIVHLGFTFDKAILSYDYNNKVKKVILVSKKKNTKETISDYLTRFVRYYSNATLMYSQAEWYIYENHICYIRGISNYKTGIAVGKKKIKEFETSYFIFSIVFEESN